MKSGNSAPTLSDDLPERMCQLEDAAFQEFAERYLHWLHGFFCHGGASDSEAEELAVSCVSDICLSIGRYRRFPNATFHTWVASIARHQLADWQRHHYKIPGPIFIGDLEGVLSEVDNNTIKVIELDDAIRAAVRDALNHLSRLQRNVLELTHRGFGENATEIGQILGVRPGTVRQARARALDRLRKALERDPRMTERLKKARQTDRVGV